MKRERERERVHTQGVHGNAVYSTRGQLSDESVSSRPECSPKLRAVAPVVAAPPPTAIIAGGVVTS